MTKAWKFTLFAGLGLLIVVAYLSYDRGSVLGGIDNIDLNRQDYRPTTGQFLCGTTSSVAVQPLSGRKWIRFTNTLSSVGATSSPVSLMMASGTATTTSFATINQGIVLASATSSGGIIHWDSGESGVNWTGAFNCVAVVTGTVVSYIEAN